MSISFLELINYTKKHVALILACMLFCTALGDFYYRTSQKYYASTTIKYTFPNAEKGLNPKGETLDAYEMVSPAVIEKALAKLNFNVGIDDIRSSTTITPFIDTATKEKKEAMLKQGEEYEYFPTKYTVMFTSDERYGANYGVQVLNRLFESYDEYIQETYTNNGRFPDIFANMNYNKYDYMEICEIYEQQLENILDMLDGYDSQVTDFRSTKTGLSFNDLKGYFSGIRDIEYAKLYSMIRSNCLSKDEEVLLKNYQYKIDQLNIQNNKKSEESRVSYGIMSDFYKQYQHGVIYNNWQNGLDANNNHIIYDENVAKKMTTYDEIMTAYVDSGVEAANAAKDIEYYQTLINDYTNDKISDEQKVQIKKEADTLIVQINKQLSEYIKIANDTLSDYNVYKGTNYISYLSSVSVSTKLSRMVIVAFACIGGMFMGLVLAIGIELIKRMLEEERLKDKRKKMQLLEKGVLPKDLGNMPPLERALFEAIANEMNEFYLLYQPIVSRMGKWVGAEAFVRWGSKEFGTIMPTEFIGIAEKYDIMEFLGKWILQEACLQCKKWNKEFSEDFFISVNFTFNQVTSRIFMDEILSALNTVNLNSKNLVLEVSSGLGTETSSVIMQKLTAIKKFGVGITADDFDKLGSEVVDMLEDMPIDTVKVNEDYIENNDIIMAARQYDFKVCAQMVEKTESYRKLAQLGVDYMQGYYFAKPMTKEQFTEELMRRI